MKQHISERQFNDDLTPAQQVKLRNEWRKDGREVNLLNHQDITIGTMIEFLVSQRDKGLHMHYDIPYFHIKNKISHEEPGHMWSTEGWTLHYSQPNPWNNIDRDDTGEELCDVLWEAVKEVLAPTNPSFASA